MFFVPNIYFACRILNIYFFVCKFQEKVSNTIVFFPYSFPDPQAMTSTRNTVYCLCFDAGSYSKPLLFAFLIVQVPYLSEMCCLRSLWKGSLEFTISQCWTIFFVSALRNAFQCFCYFGKELNRLARQYVAVQLIINCVQCDCNYQLKVVSLFCILFP